MPGTDDILGHRDALRRLWAALDRDALHHAYLFEGPEGVGKRTVAVRLAMGANCDGPAPRPCGTCPTCRQIRAGAHPDVIVLSPDPERATPIVSVDQVREVVRQAAYHRYSARRRVVIIDPAESLRDEAANALLKTLEEPPAGTGFILIATHASALLPTIVSRCQRVRFTAVADDDIAAWLRARQVPDADALARAAQGCPGRALALSDGGLDARRQLRDGMLAAIGGPLKDLFDWTTAVAKGERAEWRGRVLLVLDIVEEMLRDAVLKATHAPVNTLHADRDAVVAAWADALWPEGITRCVEAVDEAREELDRNVGGKNLLDALLAKIATELGRARSAPISP